MNELESMAELAKMDLFDSDEGAPGNALADFLFPSPARRNVKSIIGWWEKRRLPFNLIVGGTGLFTLGTFHVLTSIPPGAHDIPFFWAPVVAYGVLANICYLLGPAAELGIERLFRGRVLPTGPALFRMGLTFSVGLTLIPAFMAAIDLVIRIITGIF